MSPSGTAESRPDLGIVGFGAFGQLIAAHLRPYFRCIACDPFIPIECFQALDVEYADLQELARCRVVVIAVPVTRIEDVLRELAPLLKAGTLVLDVGSVKMRPAEAMARLLPSYVDIVGTHPLFGPHSVGDGIRGKKIVVCPLRGYPRRVLAFLRSIGLRVVVATPDDHDKEAAEVQGITHAIARMLSGMGMQKPTMTTKSYELLMAAVDMVRDDSPEVLHAILNENPHVQSVLSRFASQLSHLGYNSHSLDVTEALKS